MNGNILFPTPPIVEYLLAFKEQIVTVVILRSPSRPKRLKEPFPTFGSVQHRGSPNGGLEGRNHPHHYEFPGFPALGGLGTVKSLLKFENWQACKPLSNFYM